MFVTTMHNGKPAIFDTIAKVYYTGFKTYAEARQKADELNRPPQKQSKVVRIGKGF